MADNDPNNWAKAPGFNTWGHVGIAKDNAFYQLLDETKEKTDSVFEIINLTFALVNSALDFIASLLIDFTNPLKPILEEIIALLESFIEDLRNFGWYLTYDKREFEKNPAESLLGGYQAFENRMVQKLLDQSDPTRPNFSSQTKVFAITLFAGADATSIGQIIKLIKDVLKLFTPGKDTPAEAPINLQVGYYNTIVGDIELPNQYKPDGIRVKWNLPSPATTNKNLPKSFVLPDYFLFSVATRKAKEKIAWVNNVSRETTDPLKDKFPTKSNLINFKSGIKDPGLWPLLIKDANWTKLDESKEFESLDKTPEGIGKYGSYVLQGEDNTVYFNKVDKDKLSDLYLCFLYGGGGGGIVGNNDFSFDIPLENLKINNELSPEYFITIYSMTMSSDDFQKVPMTSTDLKGGIRFGKQIQIKEASLIVPKVVSGAGVSFRLEMGYGSLSKASQTVSIKSPSDLREKYLKAVKFYYLSLLLAQPWLSPQKNLLGFEMDAKETGLRDLFYQEYKVLFDSYQNKQVFGLAVMAWLKKIMLKFKYEMPSDFVLKSFKDSLNKIDQYPFDLEGMIKQSAQGQNLNIGIFPNTLSLPSDFKSHTLTQAEVVASYESGITETLKIPTALTYKASSFTHDKWVGGKQPTIHIKTSGDLAPKFSGHLFYAKDFKEVFNLSRRIVLTSPPTTSEKGAWLNQRPFRDSDLSSLTDVLDTVKKFVEGFLKGLEGIVAQILKYIHILKTRIAQIQAIIAKIKSYIDIILSFRFPAGLYGTFHLADGTAGLISALQQSEDKPDIGASGYGTGLMMVAGGAPSILVDLLIAIMGGEGNDQ